MRGARGRRPPDRPGDPPHQERGAPCGGGFSDIFTSIDAVVDKMQRQADRYKGKRWERRIEDAQEAATAAVLQTSEEEEEPADEEVTISRVKRFRMTPMDEIEAVAQMELLGHDFYVFYNVNQNQINVLYRRRNGQYGLIQPELA